MGFNNYNIKSEIKINVFFCVCGRVTRYLVQQFTTFECINGETSSYPSVGYTEPVQSHWWKPMGVARVDVFWHWDKKKTNKYYIVEFIITHM